MTSHRLDQWTYRTPESRPEPSLYPIHQETRVLPHGGAPLPPGRVLNERPPGRADRTRPASHNRP